jgi:hypothetical protein
MTKRHPELVSGSHQVIKESHFEWRYVFSLFPFLT